MLYPRIIPFLLVRNKGLVKTRGFSNEKYVGDPYNAVKIFNEKCADELVILDIDASVKGSEPDYEMIEGIAAECRMPLCYGGGIKTVEQAERILALGVEKVAFGSLFFENSGVIERLSHRVGRQSVVVVLDVRKKRFGTRYECYNYNGRESAGVDVVDAVRQAEQAGAGEVVINSIDNDGEMAGYDMRLVSKVMEVASVPVTVVGGCGNEAHIRTLVEKWPIIGAGAGSFFVFKGKYRAVLISYPNEHQKARLFEGLATKFNSVK